MMLDTVQHCGDPMRPNSAFEHGRSSSATQRERYLVIRGFAIPLRPPNVACITIGTSPEASRTRIAMHSALPSQPTWNVPPQYRSTEGHSN